jgi:exodeoxyribonuclease VII large subunit
VEARGRLGIYEARGELQMVVESLQSTGRGNLFEKFLQIKAALELEGLFDPARKRALPLMPRGIGVVTSLGAAAMHDVATTLERRAPHIPVLVSPASVQGDSAPRDLIQALQSLYALACPQKPSASFPIDVILLVRGGGALEDLWAFNDEALARTIAMSPVPVVCGVGHETDFTIADFVADMRAPTPTAAAELVAEAGAASWNACAHLEHRLESLFRNYLDKQSQRIDLLNGRLGRPSSVLVRQRSVLSAAFQSMQRASGLRMNANVLALDRLTQHMRPAIGRALQEERTRLEQASIRLGLLDPSLVLRRGYAWLTSAEGIPVSSVSQLSPGHRLRATLVDGTVDVSVLSRTSN